MSEPTFKDVSPEDVLRMEQENMDEMEYGLTPKDVEPKILEEALEDEQRTAFEDIMSADQGFKVYAVLNEVKNQLYRVMSITEPAISHSTEQLALSCFGLISEIVEGSVEKIEGFINNVTVDGEPINER